MSLCPVFLRSSVYKRHTFVFIVLFDVCELQGIEPSIRRHHEQGRTNVFISYVDLQLYVSLFVLLFGLYSLTHSQFFFSSMSGHFRFNIYQLDMSHCIRKQQNAWAKTKAQISFAVAVQRLCFHCTDSTILLLTSEITSFCDYIQAGLRQTWSEHILLIFSRTGSYVIYK